MQGCMALGVHFLHQFPQRLSREAKQSRKEQHLALLPAHLGQQAVADIVGLNPVALLKLRCGRLAVLIA